jgi:uncharacterized protein DUF3943
MNTASARCGPGEDEIAPRHQRWVGIALLGAAIAASPIAIGTAFAADFTTDISAQRNRLGLYPGAGESIVLPGSLAALGDDRKVEKPPPPDTAPQIERNKSYVIPAVEIVGFITLLNIFDRLYFGGNDYDTNLSTIKRNLERSWVTENDPFKVNQLGHPYQGSMYHGFARSAGLSYWESLLYTFGGSAVWEIAGETTPPSKNDQVASGIGGTFLGEALFRMASLVLENANGTPPFWRELTATLISPATGFNRLAFGSRFKPVFSSNDATYYSRLAVGFSGAPTNVRGSSSTNTDRAEALVDFSIDYGLPGKRDYTYKRPFDYFAFQTTVSTANLVENVTTRGLLLGTDYGVGKNYRGVWGLYGSYDYLAPQFFKISSTALSLGTTGQLWLTNSIALQGTAMAGAGYAAVGTVGGTGERDYHYGVAPQALLALRAIFGDKASLDVVGREYFVTRVNARDRGGHDNIARAEVSLNYRIHRQHAIALKYLWSRRDATFPDLGDLTQKRATVGIFYTLLGHDRFGATDWR